MQYDIKIYFIKRLITCIDLCPYIWRMCT